MIDVRALAHECGAVSYTPGPMRAVRGVSMTFEQLEAFAARVLAQAAAPEPWLERALVVLGDIRKDVRSSDFGGLQCDELERQLRAAAASAPSPAGSGIEVMPPRPAGYNDADTDPDSPLQRWGKPRHEGAQLLLQPLPDGYWTPWHIANEMLRAAQAAAISGDDAMLLDWLESLPQINIERVIRYSTGDLLHEVTPLACDSFDGKTLREALRAAREDQTKGAA